MKTSYENINSVCAREDAAPSQFFNIIFFDYQVILISILMP